MFSLFLDETGVYLLGLLLLLFVTALEVEVAGSGVLFKGFLVGKKAVSFS